MDKKIEDYRKNMSKYFGKDSGVIVDDPSNIKVEKFSTGSLNIDRELRGGLPKGKIVEIFGPEASGKTTLALHIAASHQKTYPNEPILWVDLEDVFDPAYNSAIGLDAEDENFILSKPDSGEDAYHLMVEFSRNMKGGLIVLDSVALLLPEKEDQGDVGDAQMGSQARLNSQGLRKLFPHSSKNNITTIFINQVRSKIGGYGDPDVTPGGRALGFYSRTRIKTSKSKGEAGLYTRMGAKMVKATYGNEGALTHTHIYYGEGIDRMGEVVDICTDNDIIEKTGSWFSYKGTKIGQGKDNARNTLVDNPELLEELEGRIKELDLS